MAEAALRLRARDAKSPGDLVVKLNAIIAELQRRVGGAQELGPVIEELADRLGSLEVGTPSVAAFAQALASAESLRAFVIDGVGDSESARDQARAARDDVVAGLGGKAAKDGSNLSLEERPLFRSSIGALAQDASNIAAGSAEAAAVRGKLAAPYINTLAPRQLRQESGVVSGVAGQGVANRAAIQALLNAGEQIDGGGRIYEIADFIRPFANGGIYNAEFRYTGANIGTIGDKGVLAAVGVSGTKFRELIINRGSLKTQGVTLETGGLSLINCVGSDISNVEITGHGRGSGLFIQGSSLVRAVKVNVHDMTWEDDAAVNDTLTGIAVVGNCEYVIIRDSSVKNLFGYRAGGLPYNPVVDPVQFETMALWTRGISVNPASKNVVLEGNRVENVDQAYDIPGSNVFVDKCLAVDAYTWGFKMAHNAQQARYSGCKAVRCGYAGFTLSHGDETADLNVRDVVYEGCAAIDCGTTNCTGSSVRTDNAQPSRWGGPKSAGWLFSQFNGKTMGAVRMIGCHAEDQYGRSEYGVNNENNSPDITVDEAFYSRGSSAGALRNVKTFLERVTPLIAKPPQVNRYTAPGTVAWTKPAGARRVLISVANGGPGGGSGRLGAAGTVRTGGSGAAPGTMVEWEMDAADLPDSGTLTVGAGGAGGAPVTTNDTNGNPGAAGGQSSFAGLIAPVTSTGAIGLGGNAVSAAGGINGGFRFQPPANDVAGGAAGSGVGGQGASAFGRYGAGAGGGGGLDAANTDRVGGASGSSGGALGGSQAGGGTGGNGAGAAGAVHSQIAKFFVAGGSGGGGNSNSNGNGGKGGDGAAPSAAGGGGGAALNGFQSGAGGKGGDGEVRLKWMF